MGRSAVRSPRRILGRMSGAVAFASGGIAVVALVVAVASARQAAPRFTAETPVAEALGQPGKAAWAETLNQRTYGGRKFAWSDFSRWGRELVTRGRVTDPPVGPRPSPVLSRFYRCTHCHNLVREDRHLTVQDPESRAIWLRRLKDARPVAAGLPTPALTPGTTLWGAVNRARFYNGHYSRYHRLKVSDGEPMDPRSLADAIEVCCRFCSGGRYPEPWERDSILTFFWELELRLGDLDLPPKRLQTVLRQLNSGRRDLGSRARRTVRQSYLIASSATHESMPTRFQGDTAIYPDGDKVVGDAERGRWLYRMACAKCHGTAVHPLAGAELARSDLRFYSFVWCGTEADGLYMPLFTRERLSRRQAADILAYLKRLDRRR